MPQILIAISNWLHALATVIFIGHFVLLSLIFLPVLTMDEYGSSGRAALSEISKRSRVWMYTSLLIFIITGILLMLYDPNYLGIGNFSNLWSILMLIKHLLIIGMIAIGFWFNAILRIGPLLISNSGAGQAIARYRQYSTIMAVSGVLVLLLTALSQVQ